MLLIILEAVVAVLCLSYFFFIWLPKQFKDSTGGYQPTSSLDELVYKAKEVSQTRNQLQKEIDHSAAKLEEAENKLNN